MEPPRLRSFAFQMSKTQPEPVNVLFKQISTGKLHRFNPPSEAVALLFRCDEIFSVCIEEPVE